ncbi:uncharacterized protein PFL1_00390 [Pseudozyma flocculosa PF-1]|uniref:Related to NPR2 - nitrogen permease regulator n=1 Tax=Pseudozyma flocculosa TaxID=84751 RepID=A0A5C3ES10_9BASI|nr:uncharacterized protein PFL1_00390 [Pseudozyma flocculosa PF-1]EPQ32193.1 hypothetical protein PFL1_00390 [Pseudozyma flocculosa PF-1]SPO34862.1 related to NPR2 - nitrogen permease regulator [Pseudozyma flocculosa]
MSIPVLDEQFLPRLVCVFYAIFHPTEGPKVVYQVPEGSVCDQRLDDVAKSPAQKPKQDDEQQRHQQHPSSGSKEDAHSTGPSGASKAQVLSGDPLFDFAPLSEYLIPKAPLCGRLVACTARSLRKPRKADSTSEQAATGDPQPPSSSSRSDISAAAGPSTSPPGSPSSSTHSRSGPRPQSSSTRPVGRGPTASARSYKILGNPILIEDAARYRRNNFIFNLCFVFEGHSDVRAYEPVVRKCGRVLRGLEESQSFLSNPRSMSRVYGIIEQLYEDLNSYCESFVALPEAPYTSYILASSPQTMNKLSSPIVGPHDFLSLGASATSLRDEHQRKVLAQHLRQMHISPSKSLDADPRSSTHTPPGPRSRAPSNGESPRPVLSPLSSIRPETMRRTWTAATADAGGGAVGAGGAVSSPKSPETTHALPSPRSRRPTVSRSATLASLTGPIKETLPTAAAASPSSSITKTWSEARFSALGRVSAEEQSELAKGLMAAETGLHGEPGQAADRADGSLSARRSSGGSPAIPASGSDSNALVDSIVSLQTIDAALSNSINALRHDTSDVTTKSGIAERREPPHGLGRTVRDAVNLKLFPTYPNPPPVNDWDVPVALLDLGSRVDGNWDLTMARIFPFIDGVNHVKRIAQLADAELGLARSCIEHLLYYGCIIVIDIFQYFNMYTVRPAIARMADDETMGRECATYVTRPGYPLPSYPELLRLYSLLRPGKNLHDWIEDNDVDAKGIDVRRFVSFGVIQGFLRRVRRYPIYLAREPAPATATIDGESRLDASMISTVRDSPMFRSNESPSSRARRDQSGSREPRDRRPRELTGGQAVPASTGRVLRDGHVATDRFDGAQAAVAQQRRTASEAAGYEASAHASDTTSRANTARFGTSPTKRHAQRARQRAGYHHPTATVIDVASVAFDIRDSAKQTVPSGPRSPRKRISSQNIGLGLGHGSGFASAGIGGGGGGGASGSGIAGASGISQSQRSVVIVPPELPEMLDGTRCDDELCVHFGVSWPELEKMLIQLGTDRRDGLRRYGAGDDSDDGGGGVTASGSRGPDHWRRTAATSSGLTSGGGGGTANSGVGGASSGWSRAARMSGIGSGVYSGHMHMRSATGGTAAGAGGESGSGWGAGSEDAAGPGWSGFGGLDRQTIEAGDLGRVKVLLQ